ncbi:fibronectin type III domain-containing protein [Paucidesulfovibrio longus]|uniref:fibronectin type III domain-containing protein n=1 Tax=Paucidesulfovibrio longus TaxID=889 RepID=UPI0003B56A18|nr:fibronectin type III domain-containing protein [Paucidesulfovibrio longus]
MSSTRNTKKKKKAVAAILLLLCAAMFSLLLIMKMQTNSGGSGGGGGGGGGGAMPAQPLAQNGTAPLTADQSAQPGQPGAPQAAPADAGQAPQPQAAPTEKGVPDLKELTWQPYDLNTVVYSIHRVLILDEDRKEITRKDLTQTETRLPLEGLGLEENRRYWYKVAPIAKPDVDLSASVKLQEGSFYVNLTDEKPTPPRITAPARGQSVASLRPQLEWEASSDNDPHDGEALNYRVELSRPGAGKVWSGTTPDTQIEPGEDLRENETYTLTVVALDPEGLESAPSSIEFSVNAAKDKPSAPSHPAAKQDAKNSRMELTWYASKDANPGGKITGYDVQVRDAETKQAVWKGKSGGSTTWTPFSEGEYGRKYEFRVRALNSFQVASSYSAWSAPFEYIYNYTFVPKISVPGFSKAEVHAKQSLEWTAGPDVKKYILTIDTTEYTSETNRFPLADLRLKNLLKTGETYTFKVRAVNAHGFVTRDSDETLFVLADSPPSAPGKVDVVIGEPGRKEIEDEDKLTWSPSTDLEGPVNYELQMSQTEDFASIFVTYETQAPAVVFDAIWKDWKKLEYGATCYIRVVAMDEAGNKTPGASRPLTKINE